MKTISTESSITRLGESIGNKCPGESFPHLSGLLSAILRKFRASSPMAFNNVELLAEAPKALILLV